MSRGLKYTIPFKTISEVDCVISLEVDDFVGTPIELIPGAEPMRVETDTSDLLSPTRSSTAVISVFGSGYLQDLYAFDPQGVRVTLLVGGAVSWVGYLKHNAFSQDFSSPRFIYEMEAVAALSTLKYKEFDLTDDFVTFREIIAQAVVYAGYEFAYLTNSVRTATGSYLDLKISSANFYDELGEAMTYYEVLEEIAKYLGGCFTPYGADLYLLDYAAIKAGYNSYTKLDGLAGITVTLSDSKTVSNYRGTGAKLSRIAGKNKAVVNCSLYEIKNILPEFNDEKTVIKDTTPIETIPNTVTVAGKSVAYTGIIRYYTQPRYTFYNQVWGGSSFIENEGDRLTNPGSIGSVFVRTTSFQDDQRPSSLNFSNEVMLKNYIPDPINPNTQVLELTGNNRIIKLNSDSRALYHKNVYFCLSAEIKFNREKFDPVESAVHKFGADAVINIPVKFRIGKYYYNGTTWTETESKFNLPVDVKKGDSVLGRYFKVRDTNDFTLGIGDISGFIVKAPDFNVIGDCEVTFYYFTTGQTNIIANEYSYMKNLVFAYGIPDEQSIYGDWVDKDSKNDLVYENVIDAAYIEEAGEIDLRICTNPDGKLALSSVIENNDFLATLVSDVYGEDQPEKLLLKRVVDLFETPRFMIDPTLTSDAKPYTVFTELHLDKTFMVAGGEENIKMESCTYNLIGI
ncbi:MAG: hypothetical protein EOM03_14490 [Clostridia bacterium]|nr:hypothetical protein [Clostridia bacterium]